MTKRNPYKDKKRISITVTEAQYGKIAERAELLGVTIPEFARIMMLYSSGVDKRAVTQERMIREWDEFDRKMRPLLDYLQ